ncbi:MAG: VanZ family protein [Gemmatimonadaceae bacterium]
MTVASVAVIGRLTLTPAEPTAGLGPWCLFCGDLGGTDFVLNVLLFVPLGVALGLWGVRRWWLYVVPLLLSLTIELLQWTVVPGRDAALGDVVANSVGGALGLMALVRWEELLLPNTRLARRLAALGSLLVITVLGAAGRLLQPEVPFLVHWVQWLPKKNGYDTFAGQLDSLQVNGVPLEAFAAVDPVFTPDVAAADRNDVRAVVRPRAQVPGHIALIARLAAPMDERFMIGRWGSDFVYRVRMRATSLGFRAPVGALPLAFGETDAASGDEALTSAMELEASLQRTGLYLHTRGPSEEHERFVTLSPAVAWAFVMPRDVPLGAQYQWWNAAFLCLLSLAPMYWLALSAAPRAQRERTVQGRFKTTVILAFFLSALASVHILFGGAPFTAVEWTGVAAAGVIGQVTGWLGSAVRRQRVRVDTSWVAPE